MTGELEAEELATRARATALLVTDVDGVLTDAGVWYGPKGEVLKRFSLRDGMGVARLRAHGVETAFMTGERSPAVAARARKLAIQRVWAGVRDKGAAFASALEETGLAPEAFAYIGDDVNDLPIMRAIAPHGLVAAPADAMPEVRAIAHYVCAAPGGHGAFRDFAEWLLRLREAPHDAARVTLRVERTEA